MASRSAFQFSLKLEPMNDEIISDKNKLRLQLRMARDAYSRVCVQDHQDQIIFEGNISDQCDLKEKIEIEAFQCVSEQVDAQLLEVEGLVQIKVLPKRDAIIGLQCRYLGQTSDRVFSFSIPNEMMRSQRRAYYRHFFPRGFDLQMMVAGRSHRMIDISVQGASIAVDSGEVGQYTPGMILPKIQFRIRNREIICDAEIRDIVDLSSPRFWYQGPKVGLRLYRLKEEDRDALEGFIAEHRIQYFGGF